MFCEKRNVNVKERIVSASAGSLITAMILTPMDVVRIRLQQQEMLPTCGCKISFNNVSHGMVKSAPEGKVFWQDACFEDIQCKHGNIKYKSTWDALLNISRCEGFKTLWRGISLTLLISIPGNIVYFLGYEFLKDKSFLRDKYPNLNPLLCGAFSRILAATSVSPLDLLRTRLQSIPQSSINASSLMIFRDLMKETRNEISIQGYRSLFKGLVITLWRDVPFSAIYWGSYEYLKKHSCFHMQESLKNVDSKFECFAKSFIQGSISGALAATLTHPLDVGKTRQQLEMISSEHRGNVWKGLKKNFSPAVNLNMFRFLNHIRKTEGIGALYIGLLPRIMKIAPSCSIMISTYELSKTYLSS